MRVLPFLLLATPAMAQQVPAVLPGRDVAVAYRADGAAAAAVPGGVTGLLHLSWDAAGQRLRVESEGRPQILLVNLGARTAVMVDPGLRTALSLPVRERDLQPMLLDGSRLRRVGVAVVTGLTCTDYAVQSARGRGTVCLTGDGVVLRAVGEVDGKAGRFTAVSVQYGPLPPGLFQVPPGYFQFALPSGGRGR